MRIANPVAKLGEDFASKFLEKKGYKILERNFRKLYGEIDIVALSPGREVLVFIEVKTRSTNQFGTPLESITPWKIKSVIKTGQLYASLHRNLPEAQRIDAICIYINNSKPKNLEHHENIGA